MTARSDRDRAVEQWLRQPGAAADAAVSDTCLDAEELAAWVDGGLGGDALQMAQAHVADCGRCQAVLGALAHAAPLVAAPAPWWRSWRAGWVVPLTAAAAVALLIVIPRQPADAPAALREESLSQAAPESAAPPVLPDQSAAVPGSTAPQRGAPPPSPSAADQMQARQADADVRVGATAGATTQAAREADKRTADLEARADVTAERRLSRTAPPPAAAPPPPPVVSEPRPAETLTAQSAAGAAAPAAPPLSAPPRPAPPAVAAESPVLGRAAIGGALQIVSPDPAVRWRIGGRGRVDYSRDSGATWQPVATGVTGELTAGAAPANSICWLVGRDGVVLLTTDGRRWQRVAFPERVDLTAVQASDARNATVTASDGRSFRTNDAGQTWTQAPLQDF